MAIYSLSDKRERSSYGGAEVERLTNSDAARYGGYGDDVSVDEYGRLRKVPGTSGAARARARYQGMADDQASAVQIDRSRSDESRGYQDSGLGYLRDASEGRNSQAVALGQQQARDGQMAQQSMAASVRGGAMARAAAARGTGIEGARLAARTAQSAQAARAGEMASARGQYAEGLGRQRGQDLGLASSQAQIEAEQNRQNTQNELFYERKGHEVTASDMGAALSRTAAENAAANAARSNALAEGQQSWENTKTGISVGASAGMGAVSAYQNAQKKNDDWTTSDARAKYVLSDVVSKEPAGVLPLYEPDGYQLHVDRSGRGMYAAEAPPPDAVSGASISGPAPRFSSAEPMQFERKAKSGGKKATRKRTDDEASREAAALLAQIQARNEGWNRAPAAVEGARSRPMYAPDVILSDNKTKLAAAWDRGHEAALADVEKLQRMSPDEIRAITESRDRPENQIQAALAVKGAKARGWDEGYQSAGTDAEKKREAQRREAELDEAAGPRHRLGSVSPRMLEIARYQTAPAKVMDRDPGGHPIAPPEEMRAAAPMVVQRPERPQPAPAPSRFAGIFSDEGAKDGKTSVEAMRAANRAMKPSAYAYKPEYLPGEQAPGEVNVGPMAQNLARDPVASTAVKKDPKTGMLALDKDKSLKLVMGGLASVQEQIDRLEKRKGAR
jgi:hypothetical protein